MKQDYAQDLRSSAHVANGRLLEFPQEITFQDRHRAPTNGDSVFSQVGRLMLESSSRATFLVEQNQRLVACNAAADRLLRSRDPLCRVNGELTSRNPVVSRALRANIRDLFARVNSQRDHCANEKMAVRFTSAASSAGQVYGCLCALHVDDRRGNGGHRPLVVLTIVSQHADMKPDPRLLSEMFELTPAETRLAVSLLDGGDLASIAADHRLSIETIRAQLKSLFSKTDTHRQAELISLLLRLSGN